MLKKIFTIVACSILTLAIPTTAYASDEIPMYYYSIPSKVHKDKGFEKFEKLYGKNYFSENGPEKINISFPTEKETKKKLGNVIAITMPGYGLRYTDVIEKSDTKAAGIMLACQMVRLPIESLHIISPDITDEQMVNLFNKIVDSYGMTSEYTMKVADLIPIFNKYTMSREGKDAVIPLQQCIGSVAFTDEGIDTMEKSLLRYLEIKNPTKEDIDNMDVIVYTARDEGFPHNEISWRKLTQHSKMEKFYDTKVRRTIQNNPKSTWHYAGVYRTFK